MTHPTRRDFLRQMAASGAYAALAGTATNSLANLEDGPMRPNIIVVVSDDQGWADIGYHNPEIRSPHLDALAGTGAELDCHYVQPQCTPTRVALLTGRYPSRYGHHCTHASNRQAVPFGTLTLARMLKDLGYDTAITGKWHLGSRPEWGPNYYGFDHSYGSLAGALGMYDHRYRLNTPFAQTWHRNHDFIEEEGHVTDLTAAEAVKWIERPREAPFFLYVPFNAVHTPVVEEEKWLEMNSHIVHPDRRLFAAAVTHMDWAVGQIIEALDRTGQRENTLVIFTSDNGGLSNYRGHNYPEPDPPLRGFSSNAPLRGQKTQVYEGGIRVPALANWPGHVAAGKVCAPIHVVDWMPTLAKLLGYNPKQDARWDGEDVWPLVSGGGKAMGVERQLYWVWGKDRDRVALRRGHWKVLRPTPDGPWELYNLAEDPYEQHDRAGEQPERLAELRARFDEEAARDAK